MNEEISRLKRDLQIIETALGLNVWTWRDVRRGFLGDLGGGAAGLFLALWMFYGGVPMVGLLVYLVTLSVILVLKDLGYRSNPAPSPGTQREVTFYNRYYLAGSALIGCYYFWGQRQGIDSQVLFASTVVIVGMWYVFYAISAPSRWLSLAGAIPLIIGGFLLPEAHGPSEMFCWLGVVACLGCWFEAALLLIALRQPGDAAHPPAAPAPSPVPGQPGTPLSGHAAH